MNANFCTQAWLFYLDEMNDHITYRTLAQDAHDPHLRLVTVSGLVVGVAGALSMGIGAFISVRSLRQINESTHARMEILE